MKRFYLYLALAGVAVCGAVVINSSIAQQAAGPAAGSKVAVCDIVEIFVNYNRAKDLSGRLDEHGRKIKAEDKKRIEAIKAISVDLQGLKEGSAEYDKQLDKMQRLTIDRKAWLEFQKALAQRKYHRMSKSLYEDISKMVAKVARERGCDVVLNKEQKDLLARNPKNILQEIASRRILYSSESVDITTTVLARLNRTYGGGK